MLLLSVDAIDSGRVGTSSNSGGVNALGLGELESERVRARSGLMVTSGADEILFGVPFELPIGMPIEFRFGVPGVPLGDPLGDPFVGLFCGPWGVPLADTLSVTFVVALPAAFGDLGTGIAGEATGGGVDVVVTSKDSGSPGAASFFSSLSVVTGCAENHDIPQKPLEIVKSLVRIVSTVSGASSTSGTGGSSSAGASGVGATVSDTEGSPGVSTGKLMS